MSTPCKLIANSDSLGGGAYLHTSLAAACFNTHAEIILLSLPPYCPSFVDRGLLIHSCDICACIENELRSASPPPGYCELAYILL